MTDELQDTPGCNRLDGADDRVVELAARHGAPDTSAIVWHHDPGDDIQAPLTFTSGGVYVISHRRELAFDDEYLETGVEKHREFFVLSWRPPGEHHAMGRCRTLDGAKTTAEKHHAGTRCTCVSIWASAHKPSCPLVEIIAALTV
jgi:hypothetical protein